MACGGKRGDYAREDAANAGDGKLPVHGGLSVRVQTGGDCKGGLESVGRFFCGLDFLALTQVTVPNCSACILKCYWQGLTVLNTMSTIWCAVT
jgi:hypothetical protein